MISDPDRKKAIKLIDEAVSSGAAIAKACKILGISDRTYFRWKDQVKTSGTCSDLRPTAIHPEPANKITKDERQSIIDTCNSERFANMPPCEIVPALADEEIYIASESTFYRVLREENMLAHRGNTADPKRRPVSTHVATAPNQVWMWDITYLYGPVKGIFFYLSMIIDLFSVERRFLGSPAYDLISVVQAA